MQKSRVSISWRENFSYYYEIARPYWANFLAIFILIVITTGIEVGHNYIFKLLIDEGTSFFNAAITQQAFIDFILFWAIIFVISIVILSASKYFRILWLSTLEGRMMRAVKIDIFSHLVSLSHSFHATHRTGSLISRLIRSGKSIENITDFLTFHGSPLIIKVVLSFALIALFDLSSAFIVLGVCIVFIIFCFFTIKGQQKANIERNEADDYEKAFIGDTFTNIETVKHFGKEKRMGFLFGGITNNTLLKQIKFWNYYALIDFGFSSI